MNKAAPRPITVTRSWISLGQDKILTAASNRPGRVTNVTNPPQIDDLPHQAGASSPIVIVTQEAVVGQEWNPAAVAMGLGWPTTLGAFRAGREQPGGIDEVKVADQQSFFAVRLIAQQRAVRVDDR